MAGRPTKPYRTSEGEDITGLRRKADGRWEIRSKGIRWTESDESKAVARAKAVLGLDRPNERIEITTNLSAIMPHVAAAKLTTGQQTPEESCRQLRAAVQQFFADPNRQEIAKINIGRPMAEALPEATISATLPEEMFYVKVRDLLTNDLDSLARKTGVMGLLQLRDQMPRPSIKLTTIIENYRTHSPATDKAKNEALAPLNKLIAQSKAKTLDDLSTAVFLAFKKHIEATIPGPATRSAYYSRVKAIIGFGLKTGMDAASIRTTLDRAKVLWTAEAMPAVDPRPISRADFHTLLKAGHGSWHAWILLGMNLCLHIEEVCALKWSEFDLSAGTYSTIRNKTRRARIPRAAVLWPETTSALKALPRKGEYVFVSTHGTRYNKNTRVNDFRELADAANLPEVTFDCLRDGAYTAACQGTEEKWARVLAGHRSHGLQDNYVLRNPEIVRPACEAVYRAYLA